MFKCPKCGGTRWGVIYLTIEEQPVRRCCNVNCDFAWHHKQDSIYLKQESWKASILRDLDKVSSIGTTRPIIVKALREILKHMPDGDSNV